MAGRESSGRGSALGTATETTAARLIDSARRAFAARGIEGASLDHIATDAGVRKQTLLYWFEGRDGLLKAVLDDSADRLAGVLEGALTRELKGLDRVDALVHAVFRLAARQPELLGLLKEASRTGTSAAQVMGRLEPLIDRAVAFLESEMDAGTIRRSEPRLLLFNVYAAVIGAATEAEVLRGLGIAPTLRSLAQRRRQLVAFLHSALEP
jgi:TetR/AcrR family transcriptional regulator